jgi:hypothetical protein
LKVCCPGTLASHPLQRIMNQYKIEYKQELCDRAVHVECARRNIRYDLTFETPLIYCRSHKASLRKAAIDLFEAVKKREVERFARSIQNCIEMEESKTSV